MIINPACKTPVLHRLTAAESEEQQKFAHLVTEYARKRNIRHRQFLREFNDIYRLFVYGQFRFEPLVYPETESCLNTAVFDEYAKHWFFRKPEDTEMIECDERDPE